jgi:hypothetical protein
MKKLLIFGSLFIWGCAMAPSSKVEEFGKVTDESGNNQLVLRFVEVDWPNKGEGKAYDFYSLAWEAKEHGKWIVKAAISCADFQKGSQKRRWISQVQSFDPETGRAILRIGEGHARVTYSWREWDVANNQEVRLIRVCKNPFEPFEKDQGGS